MLVFWHCHSLAAYNVSSNASDMSLFCLGNGSLAFGMYVMWLIPPREKSACLAFLSAGTLLVYESQKAFRLGENVLPQQYNTIKEKNIT